MTSLVLHNTLSGRLEQFAPAGEPVTLYACGPTVYGDVHVGNARAVVAFDLLYRLLRHDYPQVCYVRNITDIDDKIMAAADKQGIAPAELARKYEKKFIDTMAELGALEPDRQPRATEHIAGMVELAAQLIAKGHAYSEQGHVLFAVESFADYGQLSNRSRDEMIDGARVEVAPYKRDPADFVLWKPSTPAQPGWESPWGRGRPGWHLECSAMIKQCLGETIDIHGGGQDLVFPHHENEIAQSRCAFGCKELARFWIHNGHVTSGGRKMAKSVGNFMLLKDALAEWPGETVRYALLAAHYRRPLEWSAEVLAAAASALDRLYRALHKAGDARTDAGPADEFMAAMHADLNTPKALALLHDYAARINRGEEEAKLGSQLYACGSFLGLFGVSCEDWLQQTAATADKAWVQEMIDKRSRARQARDYAAADTLRDQLLAAGVVLEDTEDGTVWRGE